MQKYSHFFETLHDEQNPTGYLGRGTHYTVLRAITFYDVAGHALPEGRFHDFAIIWDEDHDLRVIEPIETIYRDGLLASFLFFGERKAIFTAVFAEEVREADRRSILAARVEKIAENVNGDSWDGRVSSLGSPDNPIINDSPDKIRLYLANIKMLWDLGLKTPTSLPPMHYQVVFHPMSLGVSPGNRGPLGEISVPYPTLEAAILGRDAPSPKSGYIAVKVVDHAGSVLRERTAGQHIARHGSVW